MDDPPAVGVCDGFTDLAQYIQTLVHRQGGAFANQELIQTECSFWLPEEENRTVFALGRRVRFQNAGMI